MNVNDAGFRILVAEDNPTTARIILVFLTKKGWLAEVVTNGILVLEALDKNKYDMILMDALMPEMSGYEAAGQIRASQADYADIPIIALTANSGAGEKENCLAAGMDDYLTKPFQSFELYNMIEKYIHRKVS